MIALPLTQQVGSHQLARRSAALLRTAAGAALALICGITSLHAQTRSTDVAYTVAKSPALISPTKYSMTTLPLDNANDIDESGMIVGDVGGFAAVYVNGQVMYLDKPSGYYSATAKAVSKNGMIVGYAQSSGYQRALFWSSYTAPARDMGAINARFITPLAINSSGVVVGYASHTAIGGERAFSWSLATGMVYLTLPFGYDRSIAYDIADSGFIAGTTNCCFNDFRASRWYPNGSFGSVATGNAYKVRENGDVYGTNQQDAATLWGVSNTPVAIGPSPSTHLVREISPVGRMVGTTTATLPWTSISGSAVNLPVPAGQSGYAMDVNSCGTIIGSYGTEQAGYRAAMWTKMVCDKAAVVKSR